MSEGVDGVDLRLLGDLEVTGAGGTVTPRAAQERLLLAALAVHRGSPVGRDWLVDVLWPERAPAGAVNAMQNYVLRLRRALEPTALRIVTAAGGYRLEVPAARVDAEVAERLVREGRAAVASGEPVRGAAALRTAVGLWRGPALGEYAHLPFAEAECRRLDELYESACEDRVAAELAIGCHREIVGELQVMVERAPLRERRWAQLMLALYRAGRQAEALRAYRTVRSTLADELGIAPCPALAALHERILRQDPALGPPRAGVPGSGRAGGLVGRSAELHALADRFEAVRGGHGSVIAVAGEPGIGKTALLRSFAEAAADRGATVLRGRSLEGEWQPAYGAIAEAVGTHLAPLSSAELARVAGPFADVLVRLVPGLTRQGLTRDDRVDTAPDEERTRILDGVARFLVTLSVDRPVALVLDDLHWADASTLTMLRHVARAAAERPMMIVGAYRSDECGPLLADALGALRSEADSATLRLAGLESAALGDLLGAVSGVGVSDALVGAIAGLTRGNPFFARELLRQLREDGAVGPGPDGLFAGEVAAGTVPDGVRQVLARRRSRLSKAADLLLDHAATFDGPFPFGTVMRVAGLPDDDALDALDEVLAAGLVEPDLTPDRYRFGHALVRQAVLVGLNPSRRLRLHRRLAEGLAAERSSGSSGVGAGEVAAQYHASAALPGAGAGVGQAIEAADEAEAAAAHQEAARFLAMAIDLADPDDHRRTAVVARLGLARAWTGDFDAAVETASEAAERLAADDPPAAAAYLATVASALASADSDEHAWRLAVRGLRLTDGRRDAVWASLMVHDLDRREAADPAFPGITLDHPDRREALRILLAERGSADRPDLARLAVAATYGRRDRIPDAFAADPTVRLLVLGDLHGAVPLIEDAIAAAHERGRLALESYHRTLLARAHAALGRIEDGRSGLAEARALGVRSGSPGWGWQRIHDIGTLDAIAHVTDVGWTDVLAQLDQAYAAANGPGRRLEASASACGAKAAARLGRTDEALRRYARVLPGLRRAPAWAMNHLRTLSDAVETLWLVAGPGLHHHPDVPVLDRVARETALPADFRFPMMDIHLTLARLAALDGRAAEATRLLDRARSGLEERGARPLQAIVDLDAALVARYAGRTDEAHRLTASAVAVFEELGMTGWVRRADRRPA
ncbi:BREX system ATP-binding domain-containing protein [Pseudonocardia sp. NPDC049154]|uniref:BREX system ATP-binding domain-containing protein n=1 Tax=Pseudonocardia sp. NPDC049154 TaxID=3155501 RepID=UPI0033FD4F10